MNRVIGIDLGTNHSTIAVLAEGIPRIIPTPEGYPHIPTVVAYTADGCLVGEAAKQRAILYPKDTFTGFMRFIGRKYIDRKCNEVSALAQQVPYQVVSDRSDQVEFACPALGRRITPEEVLVEFFQKIAQTASQFLEQAVIQAVIAVPVCLYSQERSAIQRAANRAGLNVLRLIDSTTAGAIAYSGHSTKNETVLVLDIGAGYLSTSILEVDDGVVEVLAMTGDRVGGDDLDWKIANYLVQEFQQVQGTNLRQNQQAIQRILAAAERAKIDLSSLTQTEINLPFITATQSHASATSQPSNHAESEHFWKNLLGLYQLGAAEAKRDRLHQHSQPLTVTTPLDHGRVSLQATLTQTQFDQLSQDFLDRCRQALERVLRDTHKNPQSINTVILLGGTTHLPAIQTLITQSLQQAPNTHLDRSILVAQGAAIQAGISSGQIQGRLALEGLPWSLGIETIGGVMTKILPRHTTIPTTKSEIFYPASDRQTQVAIHVLAGEAEMAKDNPSLGVLYLADIPATPSGVPHIEVTLAIDAHLDQIRVTAKHQETGKTQSITLPNQAVSLPPRQQWQDSLPRLHPPVKEPTIKIPPIAPQTCCACHHGVSPTDHFCAQCGYNLNQSIFDRNFGQNWSNRL